MVVKLSLVSVLLAAYFLPKMHERYFYLADVIAIAYGFYNPKGFYVPVVVGLVSLFSYIPYLFEKTVFDLSLLAVVLAVIIVVVLVDLARTLSRIHRLTAPESGAK